MGGGGRSKWGLVASAPDVVVSLAAILTHGLALVGLGVVTGADSSLYVKIADSIVDGAPNVFNFPLQFSYGVLLAPGQALGMNVTTWVVILHLALGVGSAIVFRRLARLFIGPGPALAVGLIVAAYPSLLFWTRYVLTEAAFVFALGLFALACGCVVVDGQLSRKRLLALGASTLFMVITRPTGIVLVVVGAFAVAHAVVSARRGNDRARRAMTWSVLGIVLLMTVVLAVPSTRERVLRYPTVAVSLWNSTRFWTSDINDVLQGQRQPESAAFLRLSEDERNRELSKRALTWIGDHPSDYVSRAGWRLGNFWFPWITAEWSRAHFVGDILLTVILYGVAIAAALLSRAGRERRMVALLGGLALVQGFLVMFSQIDSEARYRLPAEILLVPVSGIVFERLGERRRRDRLLDGSDDRVEVV